MSQYNTLNLSVGSMSCASCSSAVEKALLKVQGVQSATVNLATEKAQVEFSSPATPQAIAQAVINAGYEAEILNLAGDKTGEYPAATHAQPQGLGEGISVLLAALLTLPLVLPMVAMLAVLALLLRQRLRPARNR